MPAVIRLASMRRPAVAEKPGGIRVRAEAEILDMDDAGQGETRRDVARKIKERTVGSWRGLEKVRIGVGLRDEFVDQLRANLVVGLADHRSQGRGDPTAAGAQRLHGRDGGFENTAECATPTRM